MAGPLRGDDVDALVEAVAPADVPGWFTPDVAVLELAMSALDLACTPESEPLQYEGLREHYLPGVEFRGRVEHRNSQSSSVCLWTDHANGGTVVVNQVASDERFARSVSRAGLVGQVRFVAARVPLTRLNAAFQELDSTQAGVQTPDAPLGLSMDAVRNRVTVDSVPGRALTRAALLQS